MFNIKKTYHINFCSEGTDLRNFQNLKNIQPLNVENFPNPWYLGNFPNAWVSGKFPKCLGICGISQIPGYLGNFSNAWVSRKFSKWLGIWGISQMPGYWGISQMPVYLGNFPNGWVSGKFPKCLGIWGISQIPILIKNVNAVVSCLSDQESLIHVLFLNRLISRVVSLQELLTYFLLQNVSE